jgi:hypothetical protein
MAFAQLTYRESLRDIEACLGSQPAKLYGIGLRGAVAKSTLADANAHFADCERRFQTIVSIYFTRS